ncbi:MAG: response regulator transcription factor [Actinobacteria bacterium]|nr:response regulator transcription factor [Actinomycetota bacterium]
MVRNLLLVEDEEAIGRPLQRALEREGYEVVWVASGTEAIDRSATTRFDAVLLDLELPDIDGVDVCRRIRDRGADTPILMLTSRGAEIDRVVGLDSGADDYLTKPFALAELCARIRAVRRRYTSAPDSTSATGPGGLAVEEASRRVFADGAEVALSPKEFDVLALLWRHPGTVVTREHIIDTVWDENWYGSTKTLDVTVSRLRRKLAERDVAERIVTVRGVGFRLDTSAQS